MDIDIDLPTSFKLNDYISTAIPASMIKNNELVKHPCGYYLQNMPIDTVTNLAAIPYDIAPNFNFTKIDFLHLSVLDLIESKEELRTLMDTEPNWEMLQNHLVVSKLFQLHKHYETLQAVKPKSVEQLADCVALIRPNKKHLLQQYIKNPQQVSPRLYKSNSDDKSSFRRSHAIAYACTIVVQLNLIRLNRM